MTSVNNKFPGTVLGNIKECLSLKFYLPILFSI